MGKTTIKRDEHGIYIRGCGYIWRADYPRGYDHAYGPTVMQEGDSVTVSHSGGPMASVKRHSDGTREKWYSHGSYYNDDGRGVIPSHEIYRPEYTFWPGDAPIKPTPLPDIILRAMQHVDVTPVDTKNEA